MAYSATRTFTPGGGRYNLAGSSARYKRMGNLKIGVQSNSRSIGSAVTAASKYASEIQPEMLEELAEFQLRLAVKYSSGTITKARLAQYKPGKYSVKRRALKRDYIVNAHKGTFRNAWRKRRVVRTGNKFRISLYNSAMPIAAFLLLGTRKMRERPLLKQVSLDSREEIQKVMNRLRMQVVRRATRGGKMRRHA